VEIIRRGCATAGLIEADSGEHCGCLCIHTGALAGAKSSPRFAVFGERVRISKPEKDDVDGQGRDLGDLRKRTSLQNVIVDRGGLAGLSAASRWLKPAGRVRLFEQRTIFWRRATSYVLPTASMWTTASSVTLGCCTNLEDFLPRVGSWGESNFFDRLLFETRRGGSARCRQACCPRRFTLADRLRDLHR